MIVKKIKMLMESFRNKCNVYLLKGDNVSCELCNWNGKYFPNNKCPNCASIPRTRLIPFSINYFKVNKKEVNILHVAPNQSEYNYISTNFATVLYDRLDINKKKQVNLVQDLTNTNISDNQYDFILIWHVLEHIPNDIKAISEMYRLLKKGGQALVSVPIYPDGNLKTYEDSAIKREDFEKIHGHDDHCRSCGLDYRLRFEEIGFTTSELQVKNVDNEIINKYGLSDRHTVWLFKK